MGTVKRSEASLQTIAEGRTRYHGHTDKLMMAVIDFSDGPSSVPDPPHSHPHEQISYVVSGELIFFLDGVPTRLGPGDMYTVPPDVPHSIQLLTERVRLVDAFHPIRDEFLG
jgi:quercetin dioxygenase-like cupin family protein